LTASSLAIPPWTNPIQERLARIWSLIAEKADKELLAIRPVMFAEWSDDLFLAAIRERRSGTRQMTAAELKAQEFRAIMDGQPIPDRDFQVTAMGTPTNRVAISEVRRLDRIREVVALRAFTRIDYPERGSTTPVNEAPISSTRMTWCPAIENRGEGIFVAFDHSVLAPWLVRAPVRRIATDIDRAQAATRAARGLEAVPPVTASYVLAHTLSHLLIRQLSLDSGYSSTSLRERLYVEDNTTGLLIYTASGDSDGSLGGLVAQAGAERFGGLIEAAIAAAAVCSSDPLCAERMPRGGHMSGAACHACLLISETSCETGNRFLDRGCLVDLPGMEARFLPH
jgi:hypothetical protein